VSPCVAAPAASGSSGCAGEHPPAVAPPPAPVVIPPAPVVMPPVPLVMPPTPVLIPPAPVAPAMHIEPFHQLPGGHPPATHICAPPS
jgi:hypothetical protein